MNINKIQIKYEFLITIYILKFKVFLFQKNVVQIFLIEKRHKCNYRFNSIVYNNVIKICLKLCLLSVYIMLQQKNENNTLGDQQPRATGIVIDWRDFWNCIGVDLIIPIILGHWGETIGSHKYSGKSHDCTRCAQLRKFEVIAMFPTCRMKEII